MITFWIPRYKFTLIVKRFETNFFYGNNPLIALSKIFISGYKTVNKTKIKNRFQTNKIYYFNMKHYHKIRKYNLDH